VQSSNGFLFITKPIQARWVFTLAKEGGAAALHAKKKHTAGVRKLGRKERVKRKIAQNKRGPFFCKGFIEVGLGVNGWD
jgi:hypothetical protein